MINFKEIDINYVIESLSKIWSTFDRAVIRRAWKKIGLNTLDEFIASETNEKEEINRLAQSLGLTYESLIDWLKSDETLLGYGILNDDEIVKKAKNIVKEMDDIMDEDESNSLVQLNSTGSSQTQVDISVMSNFNESEGINATKVEINRLNQPTTSKGSNLII